MMLATTEFSSCASVDQYAEPSVPWQVPAKQMEFEQNSRANKLIRQTVFFNIKLILVTSYDQVTSVIMLLNP